MRNQLRLIVLIGAASLAAGATFLVACSDDTSVDPSADGGGGGGEGGNKEGGDLDGGADTAPLFDGGFRVDTFDKVLATELCNSLSRCCYGTATPAADGGADGGTFNRASCESAYLRVGFEGSNAGNELKDGGKVTLDQVAADDCVNKVKALGCSLAGAEFKTIRSACFGAYAGTGGAGASCAGSIECKKGFFCKTLDGGAGACEALRADGGACGDFDEEVAGEACSYRGSGNTGMYCKFYDYGTNTSIPQNQWACSPSNGANAKCASSLWCNETICNNDNTCVTPEKYFDSACTVFAQ